MSEAPRHRLVVDALVAAGGLEVERHLPPKDGARRADIYFPDYRVIAEVKELSTERQDDPKVKEGLSYLIGVEGPKMGGPLIFGTVAVRMDQLPDKLARNAMRIITKRIQRDVTEANNQIKHTRAELGVPDAHGLLVFVTPPSKTHLGFIGWAAHDAFRGGSHSAINSLMLIESETSAPMERGNSHISFHSRAEADIPHELKLRIASGWQQITGQLIRPSDPSEFDKRYR